MVIGAIWGAGLAYFLDPDTGKRRRIIARDRSVSLVRKGWQRFARFMRYMGSEMYGVRQKAVHEAPWAESVASIRGETRQEPSRS